LQYYSYVIAKHYIENNKNLDFIQLKGKGINNPFEYLNNSKGIEGFIYKNYSPEGTKYKEQQRLYFTDENAKKIDNIRISIETWYKEKLLNNNEYYFLLASLIESADKVANTASVYGAFLKKYKNTALKQLQFIPLEIIKGNYKGAVYNEDANKLIKEIEGDILYLDPPYNSRKYDTNYHVLETIALYDYPEIKGKTGIRKETSKKSKYCMKKEATFAFEELIKNAKFKYIILSYNNEGIIEINDIERIMKKYGKYKRYQTNHKRFKADKKRKYSKEGTIEYLHCLEKLN
jgi:adenine-specific DNA-methyltransferase